MTDYKKLYAETLSRYEARFGELSPELQTNYATVELIAMMKRALEEGRALKVEEADRGYEFL